MAAPEGLLAKFEQVAEKLALTRDVPVGDCKFTLRSLSAAEDTEAHEAANPYSKMAYLYALKLETLARSIISLDDVPIPPLVETGKKGRGAIPERLQKHVFVRESVGKFPQEVVDSLFSEYGLLTEEVSKAISGGEGVGADRITQKELRSLNEADIREVVDHELEAKRLKEEEQAPTGDSNESITGQGPNPAGKPPQPTS